ncbi:hypothetical protein [Listeria newyorkensis]|uniref:hypothetical protein n=1 Tax=Listeria newyorkensis TaxID=1497681 RepID=UPI00051DEA37|nr:hypothetical protein [Listeria newyorkensis]KGL43638.1 hypothetical protein EP58_07835 [Listeria newyorkensis]
MIKQQKMIKKAGLAVMTTMTVFSLVACGNGTKGTTEEKPAEEVKSEVVAKEKLSAENSFSDPEVAARAYMDIVFKDKTSRVKELTHLSPEQFKEAELDLFRKNGSLHIPEDWLLQTSSGSTYTSNEILDGYAQTMVDMYHDIDDYTTVSSEVTEEGAEVKVSVRGLAGKGLGQAAREVTEKYLGPDAYKYNGTDSKELNTVMQLVNFWSLTHYYEHGGVTPVVQEPMIFTIYLEKDKHGDYAPTEDTLKELYKDAYGTNDYQSSSTESGEKEGSEGL